MSKRMPIQKPGSSRQDYETPTDFLGKLKARLAISSFISDLAASKKNTVADLFYDEEVNSLLQPWNLGGWCYCNPPFAHITPWVRKAWVEALGGAHIAMLLPASVGSEWWKNWVDMKAHVLFLNGRLTFQGEDSPYPKDCALLLYTPHTYGGYEIWDWKG